ncbi:hypoxia induced protein conserved region-domain-containing protein [Immersiella caudata]|uniref:Hypoxia induced protein conserved region-domain-containing protein n=1 Tax=Immersiella caudata TaxID=314043 RepID=A0AA39U3P0_9PEZI|nr:hypoxia induced protein conserved region-domain-containing protein [Immersiella caudata]
MSGRPLPSSFDSDEDFYNEKALQKVVRRIKEEPLVPIGCILTVAAFTNAYRAMRRGDHNQVQRMFRARVAAQAFTVVAMVVGGVYYQADRNKSKELWKVKEQEDAEEKRQKWIRELEVRDAEDKALKEKLEKRRKRAEQRAAAEVGAEGGVAAQAKAAFEANKDASKEVPADAVASSTGGDKKGVLGSLGLWSSKPAAEPSTATADLKTEPTK